MRFNGHTLHQLEIKTNTHLAGSRLPQHLVIIPLAPPQPVAGLVKRHAGNQNQIYLPPIRKQFPHRFRKRLPFPRLQPLLPVKIPKFQLIPLHARQQECFAPRPFIHKIMRIYLIFHRPISQHYICLLESRQLFHLLPYRHRLPASLLQRTRPFQLSDFSPQSFLAIHNFSFYYCICVHDSKFLPIFTAKIKEIIHIS